MMIIRFPQSRAACIAQTVCHAAVIGLLPSAVAGGESPPGAVTAPLTAMSEAATLGLLLLKVFGALLLTLGLVLVFAKLMRKFGLTPATGSQLGLITILDTKMIAPKKFVAVVRVADQTLALGVTEQQITLLGRLDSESIALPAEGQKSQPATSFSTLLGKALSGGGS
ncbi:MAG: flagellar biosynthetic protein FliO [Thermodesulfobacteriota bacterium]